MGALYVSISPSSLLAHTIGQVGIAYTKPWYIPAWLSVGSPLSLKMAREGWAFVYDQKGAVYGDHTLEDYRSAEKEAQ